MRERLGAARLAAARVRFAGDRLAAGTEVPHQSAAVRGHFQHNALRIVPEVTPSLYQQLETVCGRLSLPIEAIHAFVVAGHEIQAECFTGSSVDCVLRFSSSLVDILAEEEFAFVVGHELGHFLLEHRDTNAGKDESLEHFMLQRAREISVDRIGLLACGSLEVAIRALMKTVSGLSSEHLRFDVGKFVSQLRMAAAPVLADESASHPSILVRSRALLWFSLEVENADADGIKEAARTKLDARVQADLDRYVDGPAKRRIEAARTNLGMWIAADAMLSDGRFDKREQAAFSGMFGDELLSRLKGVLHDTPIRELVPTFPVRVATAERELRDLIPLSADAEIAALRKSIEDATRDANR